MAKYSLIRFVNKVYACYFYVTQSQNLTKKASTTRHNTTNHDQSLRPLEESRARQRRKENKGRGEMLPSPIDAPLYLNF